MIRLKTNRISFANSTCKVRLNWIGESGCLSGLIVLVSLIRFLVFLNELLAVVVLVWLCCRRQLVMGKRVWVCL